MAPDSCKRGDGTLFGRVRSLFDTAATWIDRDADVWGFSYKSQGNKAEGCLLTLDAYLFLLGRWLSEMHCSRDVRCSIFILSYAHKTGGSVDQGQVLMVLFFICSDSTTPCFLSWHHVLRTAQLIRNCSLIYCTNFAQLPDEINDCGCASEVCAWSTSTKQGNDSTFTFTLRVIEPTAMSKIYVLFSRVRLLTNNIET